MTPLLHRIALQREILVRDRILIDEAGLLSKLDDVHCFEVTQVRQMVADLATNMWKHPERLGRLAFLPAKRTWIEFREPSGRVGFLIEDCGDWAQVSFASEAAFATKPMGEMGLTACLDQAGGDGAIIRHRGEEKNSELVLYFNLYAALALINTPRYIGRKQHMPHAGLQRRLAACHGMVGKFPLHATTEIILSVAAPVQHNGQSRETHLTGQRAFHWVRTHLRPSSGTLVMEYWRGNPALGIVQSRYTVVPPRHGQTPAQIGA